MISFPHQYLLNRFKAYHHWHARREHKFWHWFVVAAASLLSISVVFRYAPPLDIEEQITTRVVHAAQTVRHNYTIKSCYEGTNANNSCTSNADCSGGVCLDPVVAWWSLDESSGPRAATGGSCGTDCNLNDLNTVGQDTVNKIEGGGAASFNIANGEYLECSDSTCGGIGKLDFNSNLTLSCWVRRTSSGGVRNIFQKLSTSPLNGYRLQLLSGGQLQYGLYNAGNGCSTNGPSVAPVDTWHHWGIVFNDIAKTAQMYFDGTTEGLAQSCPTGIGDSSRNFSISQSGTSQSMDGQLDECFVANQAYANQQICEICRFGLDGEESDRDAMCGSCDPGAGISPPSDTTPPVLSNGSPTGQLPAGTTQTTMQVTTDETATCKYSTTANTSYASMPNTFSTTGSTNHSIALTGLNDGQSYTYFVRCQDTANNPNISDYPISFSVASPSAFNFSLTNSGNISVTQGNTITNTITANLTTGTPASLNFSATGLPTGATPSFSPTSCTPNCSTTLSISTQSSTPTGNSTITITAQGGGATQTTTFTLTVTASSPSPDTTPPTVFISTPANNATISGNTTVTATASDNVGVTGVTFFYDLVNQIADVLTAPFTTLWNTTGISNGIHTLIARARDAAGLQTTSAPISVTVNNTLSSGITYYVDPVTGNNANNGTSPLTPWQNPPGTRNITDTSFYSANWGAISTTNKIQCGDTIYLKGGSTQTSAEGGAWDIDSTYYTNNCTTDSRITIKVATDAEWAGASGHFTLDAANVVPVGVNCDWPSIVTVNRVDFLQILGRSAGARFRVINGLTPHTFTVPTQCWAASFNPTAVAVVGAYPDGNRGMRMDWIEILDSYFGMQVGRYSDWQVSNIVVSGVKSGGLLTGMAADLKNDGGAYVNATVHDSGCGSSANPSCTRDNRGQADGFNFTGGVNMWCVNCTSYNNGERGASGGVVGDARMTSDWVSHWRNFVTYSNGATCEWPTHPCSGSGITPSGNSWYNDALARNVIVGLVSWGNRGGGVFAYGAGWLEAWHAAVYYNGFQPQGGSDYGFSSDSRYHGLFNSIAQQYSAVRNAYGSGDTCGGACPRGTFTPSASNNCYRPASSDTQALGASTTWDYNELCTANQAPYSCCTGSGTGTCNGTGWPGLGTYAVPPAWIGPTNLIGLAACDPKFTALSTTSFASNDFNLQPGSTAIDAGRFLMLANGAGTNATTITVQANGGGSDPRYYFISPASFLDATPDTIQIKGATCINAAAELGSAERAKIVSMTATSITLDRSCTWTDGAGVHLPWEGTAPDMGAFEYTGATLPPTSFDFSLSNSGNVSVEQGGSATTTVTATLTTGTTASLTFSASGLPSGVTTSFSPTSCSLDCSSVMTLTASGGATLGSTPFTITAASPSVSHSITLTLTISDTSAPTFTTTPTSSSTTSTGTTISFATNEPATATIDYGVTSQYGQTATGGATPQTTHSLTLTNLQSSTTYHYRVKVKDVSNNEASSLNQTFTTLPPVDTTAPSPITDLRLVSATSTSLNLTWTSSGDDATSGQAASYNLRYSTSPITEANFSQATSLSGLPTPKQSGGGETYTAIGLAPNTTYYFALKSTDDAGLTSTISNILQASTTAPPPSGGGGGGGGGYIPDTTPPAPATGLRIQIADKEIHLSWTNPVDSDFVRTAIVRKDGPLPPASFIDGTVVYEGTAIFFIDTNLQNNQSYSYALFTIDRAGNRSLPLASPGPISPQAGVTTVTSSEPAILEGLITADRLSGPPLAQATITLKTSTTTLTTTTDSSGRYRFNNLLPGSYTLSITSPNHHSYSPPSLVLAASETQKQDYYLKKLTAPQTAIDLALAKRLAGRILLQVESHGEAWYVNPITLKRHYLGRPADAFRVMREQGLGITDRDLSRVPEAGRQGTFPAAFRSHVPGRILLQVQSHGEAWYVNPTTLKRHYLGRPADAFRIMREQGLGITDKDLEKILTAD